MRLLGLKFLAFSILLFFLCFSVAGKGQNTIVQKDLIGWVHGNCFAVKNPNIPIGSNLVVVTPDNNDRIQKAKILRKTDKAEECVALSEDRRSVNLEANSNNFYFLSALQPSTVGIGFILNVSKYPLNTEDLLDINGDGLREIFELCTSSEGIHFRIKSAIQNTKVLIWSGYYYLGYDVEPNCP